MDSSLASKLGSTRPISLKNAALKIHSCVITSSWSLSEKTKVCHSHAQRGFVPGRILLDNVRARFLAQWKFREKWIPKKEQQKKTLMEFKGKSEMKFKVGMNAKSKMNHCYRSSLGASPMDGLPFSQPRLGGGQDACKNRSGHNWRRRTGRALSGFVGAREASWCPKEHHGESWGILEPRGAWAHAQWPRGSRSEFRREFQSETWNEFQVKETQDVEHMVFLHAKRRARCTFHFHLLFQFVMNSLSAFVFHLLYVSYVLVLLYFRMLLIFHVFCISCVHLLSVPTFMFLFSCFTFVHVSHFSCSCYSRYNFIHSWISHFHMVHCSLCS